MSRWLLFAGMLAAVGALVFRLAILPRTPPAPDHPSPPPFDPAARAARVGRAAAWLLLIGVAGRLAAQTALFRDPFESLASELVLLVTATSWGRAWAAQVLLSFVTLGAFTAAASQRHLVRLVGWTVAAPAVLALVFTPAFSGHAYGSERWTALAVASDAVHVAAGGVWLGTLGVMAAVVAGARRSRAAPARQAIVGWIASFSPIALGASIVLAATGAFAAWLHLDAVSSLWGSPYGRWLLLKLGVLLVVVGCGAWNRKRSRSHVLASEDGRLPPTVALELAAALLILLVTSVLIATPMPGEGG